MFIDERDMNAIDDVFMETIQAMFSDEDTSIPEVTKCAVKHEVYLAASVVCAEREIIKGDGFTIEQIEEWAGYIDKVIASDGLALFIADFTSNQLRRLLVEVISTMVGKEVDEPTLRQDALDFLTTQINLHINKLKEAGVVSS